MRLSNFIRTINESHTVWRAWYQPETEECIEIPQDQNDMMVIASNSERFKINPEWNPQIILDQIWNRGWVRIGVQGGISGIIQAHERDRVRDAIEFLMNQNGNIDSIYAEWRRPSTRDIRLNDSNAIFRFIRNNTIQAESIDLGDEL